MKRALLLETLTHIAGAHPDLPLILIGAQAAHAHAESLPSCIEESDHLELLLAGEAVRRRNDLQHQFGKQSSFHAETHLFVHAIGLASITLPEGWKDRLELFDNDVRLRRIRVLELYDLAASLLLMAAEDEFALLIHLLKNGSLEYGLLQARMQKFSEKCDGIEAVRQLQRFTTRMKKAGLHDHAGPLEAHTAAQESAPPDQLSLFFDVAADPNAKSGLDAWREESREELSRLAASLGLPIARPAHVTLRNGVSLKGKLILCDHKGKRGAKVRAEDLLLRIGCVDFRASEVESCVRRED